MAITSWRQPRSGSSNPRTAVFSGPSAEHRSRGTSRCIRWSAAMRIRQQRCLRRAAMVCSARPTAARRGATCRSPACRPVSSDSKCATLHPTVMWPTSGAPVIRRFWILSTRVRVTRCTCRRRTCGAAAFSAEALPRRRRRRTRRQARLGTTGSLRSRRTIPMCCTSAALTSIAACDQPAEHGRGRTSAPKAPAIRSTRTSTRSRSARLIRMR